MRPSQSHLKIFLKLLLSVFAVGCATTNTRMKDKYTPEQLHAFACAPGQTVQSSEGSIWLKAISKEVNGQFPASVQASLPDNLKLAVSNFLGGTEAMITVSNKKYVVLGGGDRPEKKGEGYGTWGGIPLDWAAALFLGRIPCPDSSSGKIELNRPSPSELVIEIRDTRGPTKRVLEKFHFRFRMISEDPWPESLIWEKFEPQAVQVDFTFDDPEANTLSPKKWDARSKSGAVKVKWKERSIVPVGVH